jgi:predicted nucleic acid-binding Zn ribbon protein
MSPSRRAKTLDPVRERRRRVMIQTVLLGLLLLIAAVLAYKALSMP